MKLIQLTATLLALFSLCGTTTSQEIRGLNYNPLLSGIKDKPTFKSTGPEQKGFVPPADTSHIFFDDFSTYGTDIYPNSKNLWIDNSATITRTYADSSISIGAATLDCFDAHGRVYGPARRVNASDTLTSVLIEDIPDRTLYMSFFIQGGGKVDPPEIQDSIVLEFLNHKSSTWYNAWSSPGYTSHTFDQIILNIHDSLFTDGFFQFRFMNYTSLSADEVQGKEGALSNADMWHIDYVQLRMVDNPSKMTQLEDAMLTEMQETIIRDYTHVPYDHLEYSASRTSETTNTNLRTWFENTTNDISIARTHMYTDVTNEKVIEIFGEGSGNQLPYAPKTISTETDPVKIGFTTFEDQKGEGIFSQTTYLNVLSSLDQYKWNDTARQEFIFRDFYAYDDGTSEFGFGIAGADAYDSRFASKFEIYQSRNSISNLSGVYLYFNHAADQYNSDIEFEVAVWEVNAEGLPGDMLYRTGEENIYTPDTNTTLNNPSNSTNGFMKIEFTEDVPVSNEFYIGLIQYSNDFLNIGYDVSFGKKSNIAFYASNQWSSLTSVPGIPEGALMIRPKFDHYDYSTPIASTLKNNKEVTLYPNPSRSIIHIILPDENASYSYTIFNILGTKLASENLSGNQINIEELSEGIYILQLINHNTKEHYSQKLFKTD